MSDDIRAPEPADDDIPVLTDIVVPGRLQPAEPEAPAAHANADADFVFDIDFAGGERSIAPPPLPASAPSEITYGALDGTANAGPSADAGAELDLPLPWSEPAAVPAQPAQRDAAEPLIVAAIAKSAAAPQVAPPDADAQALLRELLAEIGTGLEQRLQRELAATEQRLRTALHDELDARLRDLLAAAPPKA